LVRNGSESVVKSKNIVVSCVKMGRIRRQFNCFPRTRLDSESPTKTFCLD
jgi:hypothetical protein